MSYDTAFLKFLTKEGYTPKLAFAAYTIVRTKLEQSGYRANALFYVYRTSSKTNDRGKEAGISERERWLLAFSSPDAALAFAQQHHLKPTPRLMSLHLVQLLAAMVKQTTIRMLIFTEEDAPVSPDTQIPTVFRLNRAEFLSMLRGE